MRLRSRLRRIGRPADGRRNDTQADESKTRTGGLGDERRRCKLQCGEMGKAERDHAARPFCD